MDENLKMLKIAAAQIKQGARAITKKRAGELLAENGLKKKDAGDMCRVFENLMACRRHAPITRQAIKKERSPMRENPHLPESPINRSHFGIGHGGEWLLYRINHKSISSRLRAFKESQIFKYLRDLRFATHGERTITLTDDPAEVGVRQTEKLEWGGYSKTTRYPKRLQDTDLTFPSDWRLRVMKKGIALVDGILTMDASPIEAIGCELFAAVIAVQGRGTTITAERCYIARRDRFTFHGKTADEAIAGLNRKMRLAASKAKRAAEMAAELSRLSDDGYLAQKIARHANRVVTVAAAKSIGACEYGIRSWCHRVGLDYDAGRATVAEVWAGYRAVPMIEARSTLIKVLRACK